MPLQAIYSPGTKVTNILWKVICSRTTAVIYARGRVRAKSFPMPYGMGTEWIMTLFLCAVSLALQHLPRAGHICFTPNAI